MDAGMKLKESIIRSDERRVRGHQNMLNIPTTTWHGDVSSIPPADKQLAQLTYQ